MIKKFKNLTKLDWVLIGVEFILATTTLVLSIMQVVPWGPIVAAITGVYSLVCIIYYELLKSIKKELVFKNVFASSNTTKTANSTVAIVSKQANSVTKAPQSVKSTATKVSKSNTTEVKPTTTEKPTEIKNNEG